MKYLDFSDNYNGKLFLDVFGTIRIHNPAKYHTNAMLTIRLHEKELGTARVLAVRTFEYGNIRDVLSYLDTGKPAHYLAELLRRFYAPHGKLEANTQLDHIILQYETRQFENQSAELKKWWKSKTPDSQLPLFQ